MDQGGHSRPAAGDHINNRSATIARLLAPTRLGDLHPIAKRTVLAFRIVAVCGRLKHDPVEELASQLGSLASARSFDQFARVISAFWPESVRVMRPCCTVLSPDESTLAALVAAAASDDRDAFDAGVTGFIRTERHDRLYAEARLVAPALA